MTHADEPWVERTVLLPKDAPPGVALPAPSIVLAEGEAVWEVEVTREARKTIYIGAADRKAAEFQATMLLDDLVDEWDYDQDVSANTKPYTGTLGRWDQVWLDEDWLNDPHPAYAVKVVRVAPDAEPVVPCEGQLSLAEATTNGMTDVVLP